MPQMDIRRKYTYGHKKKKKKKKENLAVAVVSGLFPWKGDAVSDMARKLVFLISVIALTFAAVKIFDFYFGSHEEADAGYWDANHDNDATISINSNNLSSSDGGDFQVSILERYREFWEANQEFVGWVRIDPWVDYPVAQSQGETPFDYYLHHNFYKVPTANGTVFADKFGEFLPPSAENPTGRPHNVILHGHNLRTRNLFQPLMKYRDDFQFLKNNPIITFDTLFESGRYKIFSVYQTNINEVHGDYYDYLAMNYFESRDEFYEYVTEALDRSRYHTDVDLRYGDELLTLSTCDFSMFFDIRLVIVARRIRDDEDPDMDSEAFINFRENNGRTADGYMRHKMFDAYYNVWNNGRGWAGDMSGRAWDTSRVEGLDRWIEDN